MITSKDLSNAAVDVLEIIKNMDDSLINQIPIDFIKNLKQKCSSTYKSQIDFSIPLEENNLSYATKILLTLLYRNYLCEEYLSI